MFLTTDYTDRKGEDRRGHAFHFCSHAKMQGLTPSLRIPPDKDVMLTRISHKIRRERTEIECWRGFRADSRVKLGRHPAKSRIQRSPHQCRYSGVQ